MINTICRDCVFATYNMLPAWGKTILEQNGCELGRITKFIEQQRVKLETVEVDDGNIAYTKIFHRIAGLCNTCRNEQWVRRNETQSMAMKRVMEEAKSRFQVFVFITKSSTIEQVQETYQAFGSMALKPTKIDFIIQDKKLTMSALNSILEPLIRPKIKYNIHLILDDIDDRWTIIDKFIDTKYHNFFSICHTGYKYNPNVFYQIDKEVNDKLFSIYKVETGNDNGMIFNTSVYKIARNVSKKEHPGVIIDQLLIKSANKDE